MPYEGRVLYLVVERGMPMKMWKKEEKSRRSEERIEEVQNAIVQSTFKGKKDVSWRKTDVPLEGENIGNSEGGHEGRYISSFREK